MAGARTKPSADSLLARIEAATERGKAVTFVDRDPPERVPWARLHEDARAMAADLQARGVGPGDRVALLGATSRPFTTAVQAAWLAGAGITVLPPPARLTSEAEFWHQTRKRIELIDAVLTIADPALAGGLEGARLVTLTDLVRTTGRPGPERYERPQDDPDAVAILQFTSGSTADPKGVMIPHRCIVTNLDGVNERMPMHRDDDVVVSWLPLYHDMGLVGALTNAMIRGAELVLSSPDHFIAAPGRWMEWMSAFRGTWTVVPNFAIAIAGRMLNRSEGALDLSVCRGLGCASEPIDPSAMDGFAAAGAAHRLDPKAMYGAYGMAEATVCIALPPMGSGFSADVIDGVLLEHERRAAPLTPDHARARPLARLGPPIAGMEARIVDPDSGALTEERGVGEIELRGSSVVPGYFRHPDATADAFHDGWLRTGDLGYLADGDLVVCGRLKDAIIVGGRNVLPQDLERAAENVEGVRRGNVVAFGAEGSYGREEVVVVAEVKVADVDRVRREVARSVSGAGGLRPADVVLVPAGAIPKTSSGKLRRGLCRARYLADELQSL